MSDAGSYLFGGALFAALLGMTAVSSQRVGAADGDAVVAAAVRQELSGLIGEEMIIGRGEITDPLYLCLSSEVPLEVGRVASELSATIIRPVPIRDCTSKTIHGNFGMFSAVTDYFAPNGDEAFHLTIAGVKCRALHECFVDIDAVGWGQRYSLERTGGDWRVTSVRNRWVV